MVETGVVAAGPLIVLPVTAIRPNPDQPRLRIAEAELADLAASIRLHGVLQPVIVTQVEDGYC